MLVGEAGQATVLLLVEDEVIIAELLADELGGEGFEVLIAATGSSAPDIIDAEGARLSALLTDIRLPDETDGWDVARHAREVHPHLPVIYMTGDSAHSHTAYGVPDSVLLQKPFVTAQLVTALATLLNATPPSTRQ